ncbi:hypothetical protein T484DRAFT_1952316 [Baffinella frigidus]|nr:hypothetical protein T484DRAFT_1952316 [Cryptophyta sp. CCMP2293]
MVCSDREGAPVDGHAGETCADVVSGGSTDVRQHVDYVLDRILTLHCPKCGMAFLDYEGCFALACRSASCCAGFCACCLKDCGQVRKLCLPHLLELNIDLA